MSKFLGLRMRPRYASSILEGSTSGCLAVSPVMYSLSGTLRSVRAPSPWKADHAARETVHTCLGQDGRARGCSYPSSCLNRAHVIDVLLYRSARAGDVVTKLNLLVEINTFLEFRHTECRRVHVNNVTRCTAQDVLWALFRSGLISVELLFARMCQFSMSC